MSRRLPVYFLVDCSGSMVGKRMEMIRTGIDSIINTFMSDPTAVDTVWLSVITFSGQAKELVPLTHLMNFSIPDFGVDMDHPGTSLGQALELLERCIRRDYRPKTGLSTGDRYASVLIFTDGNPSDTAAYNRMMERIQSGATREFTLKSQFNVCVLGDSADTKKLEKFDDRLFRVPDSAPEEAILFFRDLANRVVYDAFSDIDSYDHWRNNSLSVEPLSVYL